MNKKILSILIASMVIGQNSVGIFAMQKGGAEASNSQSAEGNACDENQVDGFTFVRQLKKDGQRIFVYTHDKTGAQVVVFPDNDQSHMSLFFKVPSEDNKGTAHVLEHLLAVPYVRGSLENKGNADTDTSGICFEHDGKESLNLLFSYLRNPEFLTDKSIFDIESHSEFTNQRGIKFNRGRVFMEQSRSYNASYEDFLVNQFMKNSSKLKFRSGGIPEEILKMDYQEVCDLYRKYIHPSNSLASFYGSDYKSMMEIFSNEYLNHYEKKEVEVNYQLENAENLRFRELEVQNEYAFRYLNGEELVDSNYKAQIGYDLGGLKDKELDVFRKKCEIINSKEFQEKVRCKGYMGVNANVCESLRPYLELRVFGNDEQKFTEENLQSLANDIMRDETSTSIEDSDDNCFSIYRSSILNAVINRSFAFYNDPFSENYFTIEGDEIKKQDLNNIDFNNQVYLERTSVPAEIMVLKKSSQVIEQPDVLNYKFKFNFKDNNQLLTKVSMKAIYEQIIRKFKDKGAFYNSPGCLYEERSFVTSESLGAIQLEDFLKNDFQSCARDFVLENETFEKIKKDLSESEKQQLDEITFEEVQNFIRSASFDSVIKE